MSASFHNNNQTWKFYELPEILAA